MVWLHVVPAAFGVKMADCVVRDALECGRAERRMYAVHSASTSSRGDITIQM